MHSPNGFLHELTLQPKLVGDNTVLIVAFTIFNGCQKSVLQAAVRGSCERHRECNTNSSLVYPDTVLDVMREIGYRWDDLKT